MKKLIILLLLPLFNFAQTEFTEVVQVDSTTKKTVLYSNSLNWFAKTFKSANNVIQMKDAETGKVIGKGILSAAPKSMGVKGDGSTWATITITSKDGKYKYEFTEIYFQYRAGTTFKYDGQPGMGQKKAFEGWKEEVKNEINAMIVELKKEMAKKDNF